jgi:hypothetical protein
VRSVSTRRAGPLQDARPPSRRLTSSLRDDGYEARADEVQTMARARAAGSLVSYGHAYLGEGGISCRPATMVATPVITEQCRAGTAGGNRLQSNKTSGRSETTITGITATTVTDTTRVTTGEDAIVLTADRLEGPPRQRHPGVQGGAGALWVRFAPARKAFQLKV